MNRLLKTAAEISARYLEALDRRNVFPSPAALARLSELEQPLPDPADGSRAHPGLA